MHLQIELFIDFEGEHQTPRPCGISMAHQIQGSQNILDTLKGEHDIELVLVDREMNTELLREECIKQGILLEEGSTNDLWRMSAIGTTDALALIGREPKGDLDEIFARGGSIWLLDGVQYPTNLGLEFEQLRSVERMLLYLTFLEPTKIAAQFVAQV